jgi:hypothetical protein
MPSLSLKHWYQTAATALDAMESAHRAASGIGPGRQYAMQQINQGYLMLVSSHFQQFCRSLHSEAATHLASNVAPALQAIVRSSFTVGRKLDQGNPNPGNLGADFNRLGMAMFWRDVVTFRSGNEARKDKLTKMGHWRNAIAHQDFTSSTHVRELGGRTEITLAEVRAFRSNCTYLARDFDAVVLVHIKAVAGPTAGW